MNWFGRKLVANNSQIQKGRTLRIAVGITMLALLLAGGAGAATITVNASGGADYSRIQDAIDNATAGDTIEVHGGTYYENVNVNRQLNLTGIGSPIVDAGGSGNAITLSAGGSTLEGFNVTNATNGIYINSSDNIVKSNNATTNTHSGIEVICFPDYYIEYFPQCISNKLIDNIIWNNSIGFYLFTYSDQDLNSYSYNNILTGNQASYNSDWGIYIENLRAGDVHSSETYVAEAHNIISYNTVSNNGKGIYLHSRNNTLIGNNASNNTNSGISLDSTNNIIDWGCLCMIDIKGDGDNTLTHNTISSNGNGIILDNSRSNLIYNNYFGNVNNANDNGYNNIWNTTKTIGKNIIGGSYLGGNVWANPSGTGFSQKCEDGNLDGICDSAYALDGTNIDYFPLSTKGPVHNINKGTNYTKIQTAINDASPGDEIHVDSGTYYENVDVNKQLTLRGVDTGSGKPIIDAGGWLETAVYSENGLTMEGFIVTNFSWGIVIYSNSILRDNKISTGDDTGSTGIEIYGTSNEVIGNDVSYNTIGVFLLGSNSYTERENNTLSDNNIFNNGMGIDVCYGHGNIISRNNIYENEEHGIVMEGSSGYGYSYGNVVNFNNISDNGIGIEFSHATDNTLSDNNIINNEAGVILGNERYGPWDNLIYNNYFSNMNIAINSGNNVWNTTKTAGKNIIGGSYLGGNVWANPSGTGFSQTCPDINKDGICDLPYTLDSNNIDYLPLAYPPASLISWSNSKTKNNNLTLTVNKSEVIRFNATASQPITTWRWYKDNVYQSNNYNNFSTSWAAEGSYTIKVNTTNPNGTGNTITWYVGINPSKIGIGGSPWTGFSAMEHTTEDKGRPGTAMIGLFRDSFDDNDYDWTVKYGNMSVVNGKLQAYGNIPAILSRNIGNHANVAMFVSLNETNLDRMKEFSVRSDSPRNTLDKSYILSVRPDGNQIRIVTRNDTSWIDVNISNWQRKPKETEYCILTAYNSVFKGYCSNRSYSHALSLPAVTSGTNSLYSNGNTIRLGTDFNTTRGTDTTTFDDVAVLELDPIGNIRTTGNLTTSYDAGTGKLVRQFIVNATTPANTNYTAWYRETNTGAYAQAGGVYTGNNTIIISGMKYRNTQVQLRLQGNKTASPEIESIEYFSQNNTKTIELKSGWNLISLPLNLTTWKLGDESAVGNPLNVTPANCLSSIYRYNTTSNLFEKSDHFTDWGWWPATGSESFTALEAGRGYWVMAQQDCSLTFTGTAPSGLDIALYTGWNLIGWYSMNEAALGQESVAGNPLNVTPANSLTSIYRYNTTSAVFEKSDHFPDWGWWPATGSESFTALEAGRGYWVMAQNKAGWGHKS